MLIQADLDTRRTTADMVFESLYDQIVSLQILPGTRISEAEVAKAFGVSRQPIREAFSRLNNLELVNVQPQRPTIVRRFSLSNIKVARFTRMAVELEVLRMACANRDTAFDEPLNENMDDQRKAIDKGDTETFHALDYRFHQLLCCAARAEFTFKVIAENKSPVDRICLLGLTSQGGMEQLYEDHIGILDAILASDMNKVETNIRQHLERLTPKIDKIYSDHREYFEE